MNALAPVAVWVNLYRETIGSCGSAYTSKELADQMAGRDRLACVRVLVKPETARKLNPKAYEAAQ